MGSIFHLLLLLLLSCLLFFVAPGAGQGLILDTAGNPVQGGQLYYITEALKSNGNGVGLTSVDASCPLNVYVQTFRYGPPMMLFPEQPRGDQAVLDGENLAIMVASPPPVCTDSTLWRMDGETTLVTTGGAWLPYADINHSRFRVVKHGILDWKHYELLSCPANDIMCTKIGVTTKGDQQLLGGSETPLVVEFTKVPEKTVVLGSMAMHPPV